MGELTKTRERIWRAVFAGIIALCLIPSSSCKRSTGGGIDILGSSDETADAAKIVADANEDLKKIKVLYDENIGKREELKKALEDNDAPKVKKISDDIVALINDGTGSGKSALEKLQKAQEMQINDDYREYLSLKEGSIKKELDAFDNYREAARTLRDNYDPKNASVRDKVKEEFKKRSDKYQEIMESARIDSSKANDLAKEALRKQAN